MAPTAKLSAVLLLLVLSPASGTSHESRRSVVKVNGGPDGVIWAVQLSDLHFSVFHPERALDFKRLIASALSIIKPSLVLITGDLTDGKSKDLLTMKQEEAEWLEYQNVTEEVIMRSGLDKNVFYDLRGNHDSFGVPEVGGKYDFYSKYSINARLGRVGDIQSITLQDSRWKYLFVGIDTAMDIGLRGPTNVFGHPTDDLLADLDIELGQWDTESADSVRKISFGHFPLSFSAATDTGKNLKDVFLKHSLSAYLCGHLHSRFGKNLKRHYTISTGRYYQHNIHQGNPNDLKSAYCSVDDEYPKEFWEWEMGDWRKSRNIRIVAIDSGHVSFLDMDNSLGPKDTIILPTFPLDSRFMQRISSQRDFNCQITRTLSYEAVRALVFSRRVIVSVSAKVFDSRPGRFDLVLDTGMTKLKGNETRGDLYVASWNWQAFADPSPDRFWLQVEAVDISGRSTYSQPRPFSANGLTADISWTWKEFLVMGCQWAALYQPLLCGVLTFIFTFLLIPRILLIFSKNYLANNRISSIFSRKSMWLHLIDTGILVVVELCRMTAIWWGILLYLVYLLLFPWFISQIYIEADKMTYMTHRGWAITSSLNGTHNAFFGMPDVMVIVLPHLFFVVLPTVFVVGGMSAERTAYRAYCLTFSGKKEDDHAKGSKENKENQCLSDASVFFRRRWMRKLLLLICLAILWKHWKQCRALVKAYDMNPLLHSPVYCFWIPALLIYTIHKTSTV
ncbi:Putative metallophosphoesterase [Apostasia shenzhenica]|uniref:Metallophosphoesterase n=1 Tax=Apostasia shenzhenica TaxID=1088818 RepID=A0A2I0AJS9_9ASPA|nr:Putative metallophosphoesterase [Apostasia shenzhenica]